MNQPFWQILKPFFPDKIGQPSTSPACFLPFPVCNIVSWCRVWSKMGWSLWNWRTKEARFLQLSSSRYRHRIYAVLYRYLFNNCLHVLSRNIHDSKFAWHKNTHLLRTVNCWIFFSCSKWRTRHATPTVERRRRELSKQSTHVGGRLIEDCPRNKNWNNSRFLRCFLHRFNNWLLT